MVRVHIVINDKIEERFRKQFVRKHGDFSKKIEELIKESLKRKK